MIREDITRFLRFGLVGGGFAGLYAVMTAVLVGPFGWPAFVTSVVLYALCIPAAYLVQMRVTFGQRRAKAAGFAIYGATQLVCLAMVTAISTRFVTRDVIWDTGIFLASALAAALLSYLVSSRLAFRPEA